MKQDQDSFGGNRECVIMPNDISDETDRQHHRENELKEQTVVSGGV